MCGVPPIIDDIASTLATAPAPKIIQFDVSKVPPIPFELAFGIPIIIEFVAFRPPAGEAYARIESPRGELGYYLVSDGGPSPFRFHIRPPSLINLSVLKEMTVGASVADAIIALGSVDIVVGEIDR